MRKNKISLMVIVLSCLNFSNQGQAMQPEAPHDLPVAPRARPTSFSDLPREIIPLIISFLKQEDFLTARRVCKDWKKIVKEGWKERPLNLFGRTIGALGARSIACNTDLSKLTRLNLWRTGIEDAGATTIAQALTGTLSAVVELNVAKNDITNKGAKAFIKALEKKPAPALATLHLTENSISGEIIEDLGQTLGMNNLIKAGEGKNLITTSLIVDPIFTDASGATGATQMDANNWQRLTPQNFMKDWRSWGNSSEGLILNSTLESWENLIWE